jgi:hypothetical protein
MVITRKEMGAFCIGEGPAIMGLSDLRSPRPVSTWIAM